MTIRADSLCTSPLAALACLVVSAFPTTAQPLPSPDAVFEMRELTAGIYVAEVKPQPPVYAFANSLVVIGEDGVLVVDTQGSTAAAKSLIAEIRRLTDAPVRWVVNTHWHGDHVYGNAAYRQAFPGVEFIGHASQAEDVDLTRQRLDTERAELPTTVAERQGWLDSGRGPDGEPLTAELRSRVERSVALGRAQVEELVAMTLIPPTRTFEEETEIRVGGRLVRLLHFGPAHTRGDVVVHLPAERIAAVGDLLEHGFPYAGDGDPRRWASVLDSVSALQAEVLVPSHGPAQRDGQMLVDQRRLFAAVAAGGCGQDDDVAPQGELPQHFEERYGVSAAAFEAGFAAMIERARELDGCGGAGGRGDN